MKIHLQDYPMLTNQLFLFVAGIASASWSWVSFHGLKFQTAAISFTDANNFIELTQPLISYLGTIIGLMASTVALIVGCWNLKKRITRLFNNQRRSTD